MNWLGVEPRTSSILVLTTKLPVLLWVRDIFPCWVPGSGFHLVFWQVLWHFQCWSPMENSRKGSQRKTLPIYANAQRRSRLLHILFHYSHIRIILGTINKVMEMGSGNQTEIIARIPFTMFSHSLAASEATTMEFGEGIQRPKISRPWDRNTAGLSSWSSPASNWSSHGESVQWSNGYRRTTSDDWEYRPFAGKYMFFPKEGMAKIWYYINTHI